MLKGELPFCFGDRRFYDIYGCKFNKCRHRMSCKGEVERRIELKRK